MSKTQSAQVKNSDVTIIKLVASYNTDGLGKLKNFRIHYLEINKKNWTVKMCLKVLSLSWRRLLQWQAVMLPKW